MKKVMEQEVKVTEASIKKIVEGTESKSKKMLALFDLGLEVKDIAKVMEVRYNFVYNVVSNHCRINGIKTESNQTVNVKDTILALAADGKSPKEISIELKTNINYVYNTLKAAKKAEGFAQEKAQQQEQAASQ